MKSVKPLIPDAPPEDEDWARRVNSRWIVHHNLDRDAGAYLDHLDRTSPSRLASSCRNARLMVSQCPPGEDPKPWLYAGLFSLVREDERRTFLSGHLLVSAAVSPLVPEPDDINPTTSEKIRRIRCAAARLPRT